MEILIWNDQRKVSVKLDDGREIHLTDGFSFIKALSTAPLYRTLYFPFWQFKHPTLPISLMFFRHNDRYCLSYYAEETF